VTILVELLPLAGSVLIVGGGNVALRRAAQFSAAGFQLYVVAPVVASGFANLPNTTVDTRAFQDSDIAGHALICACTDIRDVNAHVGELARQHGIPVAVADRLEESTFFMPALHRDGDLLVGVGTGGASPRLAQDVRDQVASYLGSGWAARVDAARQARRESLGRDKTP